MPRHDVYDTNGTLLHSDPPTVEDDNRATLEQRARQALAANRDYLALPTPSAAQQRAQLAALTRQAQAQLRFTLDDLSGTD